MSDPVPTIPELEAKAKTIRRLVLQTTHHAGMGHTGGSLSEAEILTALGASHAEAKVRLDEMLHALGG